MLQTAIPLLFSLLLAGANAVGSYIITAPNRIQPGSDFTIKVDILNSTNVVVEATIEEQVYNGQTGRYEIKQIQNVSGTFNKDDPQSLILQTKSDFTCLSCQVRLRGYGGLQFERVLNTAVNFPVAVILIQTDKAIYKPGQTVRFRVLGIYSDLRLYKGAFTIEIRDPGYNVIKILSNATSPTGVVEDSLNLGEQTVFGTWNIGVTLLDLSNTQQSQSFEVSQYELPRFEVTVELAPFALVTENNLIGKVKARYTFGQPVKGYVELHVGPNQGPDQCGELPKSTQIGFHIDGEESFSVPKDDITRAVSVYSGQQVKVTAYVTEDTTDVRLNGSSVITWYSNKYQIKFTDNTPSVFKAGLPYTAFIQVTTPDNKPPTENNITVAVYTSVTYRLTVEDQSFYDVGQFSGTYPLPGQNVTVPPSGLLTINIDIPTNATSIVVKASLKEVVATKSIEKMLSKSNNFIQLTVLDKNIKSGSIVHVKVDGTEPLNEVVYEIISRGKLVKSGTLDGKGQRSFSSEFPVSADFAPTAHLLVYYSRGTDEIVADSLAFNVEGIFNNDVSISFSKNESEPRNNVSLEVRAEPGSEVYVLAVDQSVLLLKTGNDITPAKVGESASKFDNTEKPSDSDFTLSHSAQNVQDIFTKSGVSLLTDIQFPEQINRYEFPPLFESATFGNFADGGRTAFVAKQNSDGSGQQLKAVELVRNIFPEVWLMTKGQTCANGTANFTAEVPDTISSWIASAFAVHSTAGLGVAPTTATLKVFRSFFISLTYSSSIVRGEQCVIQAVVYNYLPNSLQVTVTLKKSKKFQSVKRGNGGLEIHESGDQVKKIQVDSNKQGVVYFPIIATEIGVDFIEVTAQSSVSADGVRQPITFRPEGAPYSYVYPLFVNFEEAGKYNETIDLSLPKSLVNGSDSARVKVTGDLIGSSLDSLNSLLEYPSGCGEQSLSKFAPDVYIAQYLDATGQLAAAIKDKIVDLLEAGYQRQLTYKRSDNGFSAFGNSDESGGTWLTAGVSRVLNEAREYIFVDPVILFNAIDWLIQRQNKDGSFNEFGKVLDSSTQGTGSGPALTAYVLLSFIKNSPLSALYCTSGTECYQTNVWGNATAKAKKNLEDLVQSDSINDQFSLSIVSYALTIASSDKADVALRRLEKFAHREGGLLFWTDNSTVSANQGSDYFIWRPPYLQTRPINVLITSYAILAYTALGKLKEAYPAVQWLTKQRSPSGGFVSSQDTSVGLQALAAFATKSIRPDTDLNVKVSNDVTLAEFHIDKINALVLQIKELAKAPPKVDVAFSGKGFALFELVVNFHVSSPLTSASFDVSTVLLDDVINSFNLMVCTKYLWDTESGMVVQEISIPSGFKPDFDSLNNVAGLKRSERKGQNVHVYFDKISKTSICYSIRMTRVDKVARTQENYVRTFVLYNPKDSNTVFWQPRTLRDSSYCDVCDECCP